MDNDIRKDYGAAGCAGTSIALASLLTVLVALVKRPKGRE